MCRVLVAPFNYRLVGYGGGGEEKKLRTFFRPDKGVQSLPRTVEGGGVFSFDVGKRLGGMSNWLNRWK